MPEPERGIVLSKDLMIPMRDGVRLATDLYRPATDGEPLPGPFPVLLCRTPYDKSDRRYTDIADYFTPRGYAIALQDVRGRHRSEGTGSYYHVANRLEGVDGYDSVEWLAARPWSNGKVGTVGSSYSGLAQTRLAFEQPPHLAAMWPDVMPTNSYHNQMREGGAMQLHMFWALFLHAQDAQEIADDPEAEQVVWDGLRDMRRLLEEMPFNPGRTPLSVVPNLEKTLFDYYYRGAYDDYWAEEFHDYERNYHRHADVPMILTGGWFDPFAIGTVKYQVAMSRQNHNPCRLIIGPWTHSGMRGGRTAAGGVDFGEASAWGRERYFGEQVRFFARWLGNGEAAPDPDPPITLFVMGGGDGRKNNQGRLNHGGHWRDEREWPLARTEFTNYYLHQDGGLSSDAPWSEEASTTFTYDPDHPVPTIGGNMAGMMDAPPTETSVDPGWVRGVTPIARMRPFVHPGPAHQRETEDTFGGQEPHPLLADRADVFPFQTLPLARDLEVTGPIEVHLWITSSAVDTDFTAKLLDVHPPSDDYPDGFHMNLVDSILRTRYRDNWEAEELMEPGTVYRIKLTLPPTSNLFAAGHRIRLDVSSSNFPMFDLNPNTGEPIGRHTHTITADNTVFADRDRPSHIILPIIRCIGQRGQARTG